MRNEYHELRLGKESKSTFLENVITAVGYKYSGADTIPGLSGLRHTFDAIGTKGKNILLVVGGVELEKLREYYPWNPRARMEHWRDKALLSSYDVQTALQLDGMIVDLMFFHNVNHTYLGYDAKREFPKWLRENHLPHDIEMTHTISMNDIPLMPSQELAEVAQSVGACFLSLTDVQLSEIAFLAASNNEQASIEKIKQILIRHRILQYFEPPADELILSAYDLSKRGDSELITMLDDSAKILGHPTTSNVLVPGANYNDPVETAKALEKNKYISFEHKTELTETGFKVTQSIRKTAQGNMVVRILKSIGAGELAKAIVELIKGG